MQGCRGVVGRTKPTGVASRIPKGAEVGRRSIPPEVEHCRKLALGFLPEIYTLRRAIDSINQRYFDGQEGLLPEVAEGFVQLLDLVEKLVGIYNEALARDIERLERLLVGARDGQDESPLTIEIAELIESVHGATREQVAYMVDMAKADALDLLGEARQAFELVDRHV